MRATAALLASVVASAVLALAAPGAAGAFPTSSFTIWTIAGNGTLCTAPCGTESGAATSLSLNSPEGLATDAAGNLFVADTGHQTVRRLSPSGTISTIAGTGAACAGPTTPCGDGGLAVSAMLHDPTAVAVDSAGDVYIADQGDHRIRKVTPAGTISTVAGTGTACNGFACGDGGPATSAQLNVPTSLALDGAGALYVADTGDGRIRRVSAGTIMTVAGTSGFCSPSTDPCGDNGPATSARLTQPTGVAVAQDGSLLIADTFANRVRKVSGGVITTIAGTGTACAPATDPCGDNGLATAAKLNRPWFATTGPGGALLIVDSGISRVRRVEGGVITTIAGNGTDCPAPTASCGDGGVAIGPTLNHPGGLAADASGVYIGDSGDHPRVDLGDLRKAAELLDGIALRTPLARSRDLSAKVDGEVWLKCENLQRTGSFKIRGAYNRMSRLSAEEQAAGVVAPDARFGGRLRRPRPREYRAGARAHAGRARRC